jgi:hypothetical protein
MDLHRSVAKDMFTAVLQVEIVNTEHENVVCI